MEFYFILFFGIFLEPWPQKKIMCKFCQWHLWNFFPPKIAIFQGETVRICKKHEWNNIFVGIKIPKFQEVRKWVLPPCLENMKTGHPPTISILATDQAFDSLIHISLATNPRLWHWLWSFFHNLYVDGHKIRGSHGICKLHMKKCWKWGVEIHQFHFIGPDL